MYYVTWLWDLMAKTQSIRHMPSRSSSARLTGFTPPSLKNHRDKAWLKIFDPSRSSHTKLHKKKKIDQDPSSRNKLDHNPVEANPVEVFPVEEWQELLERLREYDDRMKSLHDDRFSQPSAELKMINATESRISDLKRPAPLTKALKASFSDRHYEGIPMAKVLANKLEEMLGKSVEGRKKRQAVIEKRDLSQKISYRKKGEDPREINVFDWLEKLFKETPPKKSFRESINQLESGVNDFSASLDKEKALRAKSTYGQGKFFELRAELGFEYLKASSKIIDYKRTAPNSYLDHLGIDFLLRVKVEGKTKIIAVQVKSSKASLKDFYRPKHLAMYNFRQRQALSTRNQRKGIMLISMQGKSLSGFADEVSNLLSDKNLRAKQGVALMPDFNFDKDFSLEKLKAWYEMFENNLIENTPVKEQAQYVA